MGISNNLESTLIITRLGREKVPSFISCILPILPALSPRVNIARQSDCNFRVAIISNSGTFTRHVSPTE